MVDAGISVAANHSRQLRRKRRRAFRQAPYGLAGAGIAQRLSGQDVLLAGRPADERPRRVLVGGPGVHRHAPRGDAVGPGASRARGERREADLVRHLGASGVRHAVVDGCRIRVKGRFAFCEKRDRLRPGHIDDIRGTVIPEQPSVQLERPDRLGRIDGGLAAFGEVSSFGIKKRRNLRHERRALAPRDEAIDAACRIMEPPCRLGQLLKRLRHRNSGLPEQILAIIKHALLRNDRNARQTTVHRSGADRLGREIAPVVRGVLLHIAVQMLQPAVAVEHPTFLQRPVHEHIRRARAARQLQDKLLSKLIFKVTLDDDVHARLRLEFRQERLDRIRPGMVCRREHEGFALKRLVRPRSAFSAGPWSRAAGEQRHCRQQACPGRFSPVFHAASPLLPFGMLNDTPARKPGI
ncbi:hypothetical protein BN871_AI_01160 [Paenibacillus sp. P22]|nr:hypothetical protein BN871_AI_01160 [Paenibacillus sp. P22]